MKAINSQLVEIESKIAKSRAASPVAQEVILVAVSKGQSQEVITAAIGAGIKVFGENRVQEAQAKWPEIKTRHPNTVLQLIGPLQSNKISDAVALFDVIATVDRLKLAEALKQEMEKQHKDLPCFIQINTGAEPQKAGVLPQEADGLIVACRNKLGLKIVGLMCVPPLQEPAAPHFALLKKIADAHGLKELSMGMSNDFETAVQLGATQVRIGTALFGERT